MAGRGVAERRVLKVDAGGESRRARDRLAVEEPLELRVAGRPVTAADEAEQHRRPDDS